MVPLRIPPRMFISLFLALSLIQPLLASEVRGLVEDPSGRPLANVLVALLDQSSEHVLPVLTRSDERGVIRLQNIEPGHYRLLVKSAVYVAEKAKLFQVVPGETTVVRLILQQLFPLGLDGEKNVDVKTLLRAGGDARLIFRSLPGVPGGMSAEPNLKSMLGEAVVEVFSNAGLGSDYLVAPGDAAGGASTNFGVTRALGAGGRHILAGQLNSGEDSLWRLKNAILLPQSDSHTLGVTVGYSRLSFQQPRLGLLEQPMALADDLDYTRALGTTKILSLGFHERFDFGERVSLLWGLEMNRVDAERVESFLSPNAELSLAPIERTRVQLSMAAKPGTYDDSLTLPDGGVVNLREAAYFSRIDEQLRVGTSRYYRGSVVQQLDQDTEVEFAVYQNDIFAGALPVVVTSSSVGSPRFLYMDKEKSRSHGYQVKMRRSLGATLDTSIWYIRGNANGINAGEVMDTEAPLTLASLLERRSYHALASQVEAYIPCSQTYLNAIVKFVPGGDPIDTFDALTDSYETGNEGVNLFVRQVVPVPPGWFTFLGLDFLSAYKIEALLDVRNLTNHDLGSVHSEEGEVSLIRNPRTVRGGISVRF